MVFLLELVKDSSLSLPSLDLSAQILPLSLQLAHNVFTLLKQSFQILDLLVFIPNLTQHLLQVILQHGRRIDLILCCCKITFMLGLQCAYT